ncbi:hypothetical protein A4R26_32335 [Niastella populi]|uniref:Uncharacterized protein n=1 Tax=Niastella populi TaxID=550983 RepID=A0A1V9EGR1_9BACT|nr:hypothetical protein A4R26_32335 [Niastella populi]
MFKNKCITKYKYPTHTTIISLDNKCVVFDNKRADMRDKRVSDIYLLYIKLTFNDGRENLNLFVD